MGVMERTSRGAPCIFCGDVGYDMRITYNENGEQTQVHWCHKTHASKGDIVSVGAKSYICKTAAKVIDIGEFDLWEEYLSKDEWIEKQKRINPDWKPGKMSHGSNQNRRVELNISSNLKSTGPITGEEPVLPREKLHEIYSYLLSMLVIEEKHKKQLEDEWCSSVHPSLYSDIMGNFPIKSLPPIDKARFANNERFKNPTRKALISKLLERFGDLRGVPGLYLRSGNYYKDKPDSERWTFSFGEGIVFPCYDKDGYLYRIRYRDDYPDLEIREGRDKAFEGFFGSFHHSYDKDGKHTWTFYPNSANEPGGYNNGTVVYNESLGIRKILLNHKGLPDVGGKVSGKYKYVSSVYEKNVDGKKVNMMEGGSRSGVCYSLYQKPGQSFTVVIGTEGEKKGIVSCVIKNVPTAIVAGVGCYDCLFEPDSSGKSCIDYLKEKGMKYFILCYDADKSINSNVLKAEQRFVQKLKEHGVIPCIGDWRGKFDKGLDGILVMGLDITIHPA